MSDTIPFVFGFDEEGKTITVDLAKESHISVFGPTASGKSVLLSNLMLSLTNYNSPSQVSVILFDIRRSTYSSAFSSMPHVINYATDVESIAESLKNLASIVTKRLEILADNGFINWDQFRSQLKRESYNDVDYSNIFVVFDELTSTIAEAKATSKELYESVNASLSAIARTGHNAGIRLISSSQKTSSDAIPKNIVMNSSFKLAFKPDERDYSVLGANKNNLPVLTEAGQCLYISSGMASASTAHTVPPYLQGAAFTGHLKLAAEHWKAKQNVTKPAEVVVENEEDFGVTWKKFLSSN